jgi:hypothetical protein
VEIRVCGEVTSGARGRPAGRLTERPAVRPALKHRAQRAKPCGLGRAGCGEGFVVSAWGYCLAVGRAVCRQVVLKMLDRLPGLFSLGVCRVWVLGRRGFLEAPVILG